MKGRLTELGLGGEGAWNWREGRNGLKGGVKLLNSHKKGRPPFFVVLPPKAVSFPFPVFKCCK